MLASVAQVASLARMNMPQIQFTRSLADSSQPLSTGIFYSGLTTMAWQEDTGILLKKQMDPRSIYIRAVNAGHGEVQSCASPSLTDVNCLAQQKTCPHYFW